MQQVYKDYSEEDQKVWQTLFTRQAENLRSKCCQEYLDCLDFLYPELNKQKLPSYSELDQKLMQSTGWSIEVVPGLIPVEDFFELLAEKRFSASTWIRRMDQLDYLEEPDMFHDIFGHIPLIADQKFAQFMCDFGKLGKAMVNNKEVVIQLQRLYWFTIEFGLIKQAGQRKVFGAGICSSFGETEYCLDNKVEVIPFTLQEVIKTEYRTDIIQTKYFELESFDQLFSEFHQFEKQLLQSAS